MASPGGVFCTIVNSLHLLPRSARPIRVTYAEGEGAKSTKEKGPLHHRKRLQPLENLYFLPSQLSAGVELLYNVQKATHTPPLAAVGLALPMQLRKCSPGPTTSSSASYETRRNGNRDSMDDAPGRKKKRGKGQYERRFYSDTGIPACPSSLRKNRVLFLFFLRNLAHSVSFSLPSVAPIEASVRSSPRPCTLRRNPPPP